MKIPLRLLLRPYFWRNVWSLPMTAKAFTGTSGLLELNKKYMLGVQLLFCIIYTMSCSEDLFHMIVGCDYKWKYRSDIFVSLSLQSWFPNKPSVWADSTFLLSTTGTLRSNKMKPIPNDTLVIVVTVFSTGFASYRRNPGLV